MMNQMHHTLSDRTTHVTSALAWRDEHAADYNLVQAKLKSSLHLLFGFPAVSTITALLMAPFLFVARALQSLVSFFSLLEKDNCIFYTVKFDIS